MKIAVIVPTIREESLKKFLLAWQDLFLKHNINLYIVHDGEKPYLEKRIPFKEVELKTVKDVMGEYSDLIFNFNDGVRNLGFAEAYKDGNQYIISLDDDVLPYGDTIQDHLNVLQSKKPISFINSVEDIYMRGFPYWAREEAPVMFSHGLWHGVYDFDASTQLVLGTPTPKHIKMPVPKGIMMPVCVMNVAFNRNALPYYYQAPMYGDINRFADIWSGWEVKKWLDKNNWAMVNGYATVRHERASNPFKNLIKEAKGVEMNENYTQGIYDKYYKDYQTKLKLWKKFLEE